MTFTKVAVSDDETAVKFETKNTYDVAGMLKRHGIETKTYNKR